MPPRRRFHSSSPFKPEPEVPDEVYEVDARVCHDAYGLGRMYEAYRSFQPGSTKEVAVFRTAPEALAFLGLHGVVLDPVK